MTIENALSAHAFTVLAYNSVVESSNALHVVKSKESSQNNGTINKGSKKIA